MKKLLLLLTLCAALVGCDAKTVIQHTEQTKPASPLQWEMALPASDYHEIIPFSDKLVLLRFSKENTVLDLFSLDTLEIIASTEISGIVSQKNGTIQYNEDSVTYFDSETNSVHVLNLDFDCTEEIPVPWNHNGIVVISSDSQNAFFCSNSGVCSLNLSTGITRLLKDEANTTLQDGLYGAAILACSDSEQNPFYVYSSDGRSFTPADNATELQTSGDLFTAVIHTQWESFRVIGKQNFEKKVFLPEADSYSLVPGLDAIITTNNNPGCTTISAYDIISGKQIAYYPTNASKSAFSFVWHKESSSLIYLTSTVFDKFSICSLDLQKTKAVDAELAVTKYFTSENPDLEGISALQSRISSLNDKYHVEVALSPSSFHQLSQNISFVEEYRVPPYEYAIEKLENALEKLSMCDLSLAAKNTPGKRIFIGIFHEVVPDESPLNHAYFWSKGDFYIALSCEKDIEDQFYHGLGYFLESRINSLGNYFDQWDDYNPDDFRYYRNFLRVSEPLTEEEMYYFVSPVAMISASEDRAELFRVAMQEESFDTLDSNPLQSKLQTLSKGLRLVFQLSEESAPPWEINLQ